MRKTFLAVLLVAACAASARAKDPIIIIENGVSTGFDRQGIVAFANDFENNPRTLTLQVLGHSFDFIVPSAGCGANCTQFTFKSSELGINRTFNGANTSDLTGQFRNFVKQDSFLKPFMRLMNAGPGAQISGSPVTTMGSAVRAGFQETIFGGLKTGEDLAAKTPPGTDPQFSGGFAQFTTDGYQGKVLAFTPGFTLDFGEKRDRHLKFSFPVARTDFEGLMTYRAGMALQYLHPFYFDGGWTLTFGPGVSYSMTVSQDLPVYTGLIGGAMSTSLQKDWDRYFATGGLYYGRFTNLGGIDTDILANIYGWGGQLGRRWSNRWVTALQVVGIHERVANVNPNTYHTVGLAVTYKIFHRFDLTLSANKMFGLPNEKVADFGLGSAWFF